jgi:hypothetical protein
LSDPSNCHLIFYPVSLICDEFKESVEPKE